MHTYTCGNYLVTVVSTKGSKGEYEKERIRELEEELRHHEWKDRQRFQQMSGGRHRMQQPRHRHHEYEDDDYEDEYEDTSRGRSHYPVDARSRSRSHYTNWDDDNEARSEGRSTRYESRRGVPGSESRRGVPGTGESRKVPRIKPFLPHGDGDDEGDDTEDDYRRSGGIAEESQSPL